MTEQAPSPCVCKTPYPMTPQQWRDTHKDYKGIHRDEQGRIAYRSALRYCPVHGTTLAAVTITK